MMIAKFPKSLRAATLAVLSLACASAFATATDELRNFVKTVKSGKSTFTQTVTSPLGCTGRINSRDWAACTMGN